VSRALCMGHLAQVQYRASMIPDQFLSRYVSTQAALHVMTLRFMAGSNLKLKTSITGSRTSLMYMHAPL
jgi:hypothetical protein